MREFDIKVAYLYEDEPCCGAAYHTFGFLSRFKEHATNVFNSLKERGVKEIITLNPICAAIMKLYYPQFVKDFDIKVMTFTEVVHKEIMKRELKYNVKITFHDPCCQVRYLNQADEIRSIFKNIKGLSVVEPVNTKQFVRCCGAGGVEVIYPEIGEKMAKARVKELIDTNADIFVTACPICILMLRVGLDLLKVNKEVIDISTLIYRALGLE
ncbi:MAG: (Fe-S)-binding protein [Nitrososphaerota archaeon]|nr:(Fe-S)-binding protein [Nitrososphaerota archaeon]